MVSSLTAKYKVMAFAVCKKLKHRISQLERFGYFTGNIVFNTDFMCLFAAWIEYQKAFLRVLGKNNYIFFS